MSNAADIALLAIRALDRANNVIANNITNVNTGGFQKSRAATAQAVTGGVTPSVERMNTPVDTVTIRGGSRGEQTSNVNLEEELIALAANRHTYDTNIETLKTTEEMQGTLFDLLR